MLPAARALTQRLFPTPRDGRYIHTHTHQLARARSLALQLLCDYAAEENAPWQVGDQVEAVWLEDDVFYLATVVNVWNGGKFYDVEFTEYGNLQERTPADCVRPLTDEEDLRSMGLLSEAQTSAHVPDEVWKTIVHAAARDMPKRAVQVGTTLHEHAFDGLRAVKWLRKWRREKERGAHTHHACGS